MKPIVKVSEGVVPPPAAKAVDHTYMTLEEVRGEYKTVPDASARRAAPADDAPALARRAAPADDAPALPPRKSVDDIFKNKKAEVEWTSAKSKRVLEDLERLNESGGFDEAIKTAQSKVSTLQRRAVIVSDAVDQLKTTVIESKGIQAGKQFNPDKYTKAINKIIKNIDDPEIQTFTRAKFDSIFEEIKSHKASVAGRSSLGLKQAEVPVDDIYSSVKKLAKTDVGQETASPVALQADSAKLSDVEELAPGLPPRSLNADQMKSAFDAPPVPRNKPILSDAPQPIELRQIGPPVEVKLGKTPEAPQAPIQKELIYADPSNFKLKVGGNYQKPQTTDTIYQSVEQAKGPLIAPKAPEVPEFSVTIAADADAKKLLADIKVRKNEVEVKRQFAENLSLSDPKAAKKLQAENTLENVGLSDEIRVSEKLQKIVSESANTTDPKVFKTNSASELSRYLRYDDLTVQEAKYVDTHLAKYYDDWVANIQARQAGQTDVTADAKVASKKPVPQKSTFATKSTASSTSKFEAPVEVQRVAAVNIPPTSVKPTRGAADVAKTTDLSASAKPAVKASAPPPTSVKPTKGAADVAKTTDLSASAKPAVKASAPQPPRRPAFLAKSTDGSASLKQGDQLDQGDAVRQAAVDEIGANTKSTIDKLVDQRIKNYTNELNKKQAAVGTATKALDEGSTSLKKGQLTTAQKNLATAQADVDLRIRVKNILEQVDYTDLSKYDEFISSEIAKAPDGLQEALGKSLGGYRGTIGKALDAIDSRAVSNSLPSSSTFKPVLAKTTEPASSLPPPTPRKLPPDSAVGKQPFGGKDALKAELDTQLQQTSKASGNAKPLPTARKPASLPKPKVTEFAPEEILQTGKKGRPQLGPGGRITKTGGFGGGEFGDVVKKAGETNDLTTDELRQLEKFEPDVPQPSAVGSKRLTVDEADLLPQRMPERAPPLPKRTLPPAPPRSVVKQDAPVPRSALDRNAPLPPQRSVVDVNTIMESMPNYRLGRVPDDDIWALGYKLDDASRGQFATELKQRLQIELGIFNKSTPDAIDKLDNLAIDSTLLKQTNESFALTQYAKKMAYKLDFHANQMSKYVPAVLDEIDFTRVTRVEEFKDLAKSAIEKIDPKLMSKNIKSDVAHYLTTDYVTEVFTPAYIQTAHKLAPPPPNPLMKPIVKVSEEVVPPPAAKAADHTYMTLEEVRGEYKTVPDASARRAAPAGDAPALDASVFVGDAPALPLRNSVEGIFEHRKGDVIIHTPAKDQRILKDLEQLNGINGDGGFGELIETTQRNIATLQKRAAVVADAIDELKETVIKSKGIQAGEQFKQNKYRNKAIKIIDNIDDHETRKLTRTEFNSIFKEIKSHKASVAGRSSPAPGLPPRSLNADQMKSAFNAPPPRRAAFLANSTDGSASLKQGDQLDQGDVARQVAVNEIGANTKSKIDKLVDQRIKKYNR